MKRNSGYKIGRATNVVLSVALTVALMITVYHEWSKYGEYTVFSFLCSVIFHGSGGVVFYCLVDYLLKRFLKEDEN